MMRRGRTDVEGVKEFHKGKTLGLSRRRLKGHITGRNATRERCPISVKGHTSPGAMRHT